MNSEQKQALINAALHAQQQAYAPYSHYQVGAALLATSGEMIEGCNVENASFGATICAEQAAVVSAVSRGIRDFEAVAVVTPNAGSPCGICRQVMNEFAPDLLVIICDQQGKIHDELPLHALLARGFGPRSLP